MDAAFSAARSCTIRSLGRSSHSPTKSRLRSGDRFAAMKEDYLKNGAARSNLRYGYVRKPDAAATA